MKTCKVEGCNEPTFKHFAYCHAHQKGVWREEKKRQSSSQVKNTQRKNQQKPCVVDGCNESRYLSYSRCHLHYIEDNQQKVCIVDGCGESRYKKNSTCHHHYLERKREQNIKQYEKLKRENKSTYNPDYYANLTPEEKEERRVYLRDKKREQRARERAERDGLSFGDTSQTLVQTATSPKKSADLAKFPRLLVVDEAKGEYVEYEPIKRVSAKSRASFRTTVGILSNRQKWLVARKDTDDV